MHHTQEREQKIRLWLDMWLRREDLGILELFAPDAVYLESWGPEYHGAAAIRHWFQEWNTRGRVEVPIWYWQGHAIWGMTARIVRDLIKE